MYEYEEKSDIIGSPCSLMNPYKGYTEGTIYNRGIQMYRFPNSDVQKSVIFEGIKKRLKIV